MMKAIWITIIIVSALIEYFTVDLVSIWFTAGAIFALICELFGLSMIWQVAIFIVISSALIILSQPLVKRYMRGNIVRTNADRLIGKHALVLKPIDLDSKGEVKVLGSIWAASEINNQRVEKNDHVEVLAIEGAHLIVKKI